jgi:hypothetical protein
MILPTNPDMQGIHVAAMEWFQPSIALQENHLFISFSKFIDTDEYIQIIFFGGATSLTNISGAYIHWWCGLIDEYRGARADRYGPAYIRRLTNEYRRHSNWFSFPFRACPHATKFICLRVAPAATAAACRRVPPVAAAAVWSLKPSPATQSSRSHSRLYESTTMQVIN